MTRRRGARKAPTGPTGAAARSRRVRPDAGRIGLTAIGDSPDQANALFQRVKSVFDEQTA